MHDNLSGTTKAVCYREVSTTIGEFVIRGSTVVRSQLKMSVHFISMRWCIQTWIVLCT